jgi:hypothetical protein
MFKRIGEFTMVAGDNQRVLGGNHLQQWPLAATMRWNEASLHN